MTSNIELQRSLAHKRPELGCGLAYVVIERGKKSIMQLGEHLKASD